MTITWRWSSLHALVLVSVVLVSIAGCTEGTPTIDHQQPGERSPPSGTPVHTLTIESTNGSVQYSVTASEWIRGDVSEGERPQGTRLSGRVGSVPWNDSATDTKDTIEFAGYIESFQYNGDGVRVSLNGQSVSPEILSANHLTVRRQSGTTATNPISYRIVVDGATIVGETSEPSDTITDVVGAERNVVDGTISGSNDSFYFSGSVRNRTINQGGEILINGRPIPDSETGAYPTGSGSGPTAPAQTPVASPSMVPTPPTQPNTVDSHSPTTFPTHPGPLTPERLTTAVAQSRDTDRSVLGLAGQLLSGLILVGLLAAVVWRYIPRQDRW